MKQPSRPMATRLPLPLRSPSRRLWLRAAWRGLALGLLSSRAQAAVDGGVHGSPARAGAASVTIPVSGPAKPDPAGEAFITELLGRMSLEEKAGQLTLLSDTTRPPAVAINPATNSATNSAINPAVNPISPTTSPQAASEPLHDRPNEALKALMTQIAKGQVTGVFNGFGAASARRLQQQAITASRLKIPLVFAADVIHGLRTVFPVPLAEAASFDPQLAERTARAAAREASAAGIHWTFAPMVDVARDQRWGRVVEGSGEDPVLGALMAAARVRGFQGASLRDDTTVLATLKHFAAYGAVTGGMDYNSVELAETTLREVHLPPFEAGIGAGALAVMSAFNDINGVPATANAHLLDTVLRDQWGFQGLVVSDYTADAELVAHGFATDEKDAAHKAILAGCDISMQSGLYLRHLPALVREGALPLAVLDRAVRRVLRIKWALGLFQNPYRSLDPARERTQLQLTETLALSREAACRSIVMLKNEGGLLPLRAHGQRIALLGPFGDDHEHLFGPWTLWADTRTGISVAAGLRAAMTDARANAQASANAGADASRTSGASAHANASVDAGVNADADADADTDTDADADALVVRAGCAIEGEAHEAQHIDPAAIEAARQADVVILALGERHDMSGEAQSRADIGLPAPQLALAAAVMATGTPVVLLLRHGRALALDGPLLQARAVLAGWFLGSQTGHAVADVVFGKVSPSGRLPVSFPQASGQQPYFYNHKSTGRPQLAPDDAAFKARYREFTHAPRYPFGHGLTYGDVRYAATRCSATALAWGGQIEVTAQLHNAGRVAVEEVAQLYVHARSASLTRPVRELKGFRRVSLQAGERTNVRFVLSRNDLAFVRSDLKREAEAGVFDVWVAPSAAAGVAAQIRLLPAL